MIDFNEKAVGETIKQIRNERGITQEVLSGLAGLGRSHIAMIENNKKQANFKTLWQIANAFNIKPSDLVKRIEQNAEK